MPAATIAATLSAELSRVLVASEGRARAAARFGTLLTLGCRTPYRVGDTMRAMTDTPCGGRGDGSNGWDVTTGPGVTALGLAAARAVETSRKDRLVEDPFARRLFQAADADLPMLVAWPEEGAFVSDTEALHLHGSRYIGLRTRFYDDALVAAAHDGIRQTVLLGAGLDTRAFRLDLPDDTLLVEVDQAGVLTFKDAVLRTHGVQPRCRRLTVGIDLRADWTAELPVAGFDRERPTAWIAEGLLPYLPPAARDQLLEQISEQSSPGSTLAFDRIAGDATNGDRLQALSTRSGVDMNQLLAGGEGDDPHRLLQQRGWKVTEQPTGVLADRYKRNLDDPFHPHDQGENATEPPWLETIFLTARMAPL